MVFERKLGLETGYGLRHWLLWLWPVAVTAVACGWGFIPGYSTGHRSHSHRSRQSHKSPVLAMALPLRLYSLAMALAVAACPGPGWCHHFVFWLFSSLEIV